MTSAKYEIEQKIKSHIQKGKTEKAIELLLAKISGFSKRERHRIYNISSQWNVLDQQILDGTITSDQLFAERNKIHLRILSLFDTSSSMYSRANTNLKLGRSKWLLIAGITLLAGTIVLSRFNFFQPEQSSSQGPGIEGLEAQDDEEIVQDFDGNRYKTVRIGKMVWMLEDLKTTRTPDGNRIPEPCLNNESANLPGYYSWSAAMDQDRSYSNQGICPNGWHVPSDSEWKKLEILLGMDPADTNRIGHRKLHLTYESFAQNALLESFHHHFEYFNCENGKPGKKRTNPFFKFYWTSTETENEQGEIVAFRRRFDGDKPYQIQRYGNNRTTNLFCIRCIKDD